MKKQGLMAEINKLLNKPVSLWQKFHNSTKIKRLPNDKLDPKSWPKTWKEIYYKAYGRMDEVTLPPPILSKRISFVDVLRKRKSTRQFTGRSLSLSQISALLYFSAGLQSEKRAPFRFYPSAGARYPLETYIFALNIRNLSPGLFHYYSRHHSIEKLLAFKKFDFSQYFNQDWIKQASALLLISALFERTTSKYGDRSYRHILTEAGHIAQNYYLTSSALNIGCCAIGGFIDDKLNQLLDIDGINESVIYVLAVGTM